MIIKPAQAASFLKNPPATCRVFLFYGPDAGQVHLRGLHLARATVPDLGDAFQVSLLTSEAIKDDPARLMDDMAALSMMGGQRLVLVREATDAVALALADVLGKIPHNDTRLILLAGELDKRSKLRSVVEQHDAAAAIACYTAEGAQRLQLIRDMAAESLLAIDARLVGLLDQLLPSDQQGMKAELEKLALYAGAKKLDDTAVLEALGDAHALDVDDYVRAFYLRQAAQLGYLADKMTADDVAVVTVLRALQRHAWRLLDAQNHMHTGQSAEVAMKKLSPPVFWKEEKPFLQQLALWSAPVLTHLLIRLQDMEVQAKSGQQELIYGALFQVIRAVAA
ncbi:MAG: DNA polymerase III subunit delta [Alphaproteobacteria bacterium]|nr:DNA polymerase III subunit delta [Alphaproteobacteria bacterium]